MAANLLSHAAEARASLAPVALIISAGALELLELAARRLRPAALRWAGEPRARAVQYFAAVTPAASALALLFALTV